MSSLLCFRRRVDVFGSRGLYECVRRPNCFLADVVADEFCSWSALTAEADSHGVVDEHRPVDLPPIAKFPIRGGSPIRATIIGLELAEYPPLLIVESVAQRRRCRGQRFAP